jgi:cytoskeletal protein RodZ
MAPIHLREISSDGVLLPGDVAAELYAARLQRGVDLREVSAELRIRYDHLLAIEENRFSDLPGPAYVIGFLRSYAAYLGLDADLLVQRFKDETTEFEPRQDLNALEPYDEGGMPTGALILLALVLVASAYGGWYYVVNLDETALEMVPEVPERMVAALAPEPVTAPPLSPEPAPEPAPAPEIVPESTLPAGPVQGEPAPEPMANSTETATATVTAPAMSAVEAGASPSPAPITSDPITSEPVTAAPAIPVVLSEDPFDAMLASAAEQNPSDDTAPAPEPAAEALPAPAPVAETALIPEPIPLPAALPEAAPLETASAQPVIPPPMIASSDYLPRVFGQANVGSTITLRALEESWVQVTGINNELLLTRILRPGDIYHVPNRPGLMLMTGNAGGIEILVGGKLAPPLGKIGKVRRQVALDPVKLLGGSANEP